MDRDCYFIKAPDLEFEAGVLLIISEINRNKNPVWEESGVPDSYGKSSTSPQGLKCRIDAYPLEISSGPNAEKHEDLLTPLNSLSAHDFLKLPLELT